MIRPCCLNPSAFVCFLRCHTAPRKNLNNTVFEKSKSLIFDHNETSLSVEIVSQMMCAFLTKMRLIWLFSNTVYYGCFCAEWMHEFQGEKKTQVKRISAFRIHPSSLLLRTLCCAFTVCVSIVVRARGTAAAAKARAKVSSQWTGPVWSRRSRSKLRQ